MKPNVNPTGKSLKAAVMINGQGVVWQNVIVPAWGTVTLHKANHVVNETTVPADDQFRLNPTPANTNDVAPGKEIK